LLSFIVASSSFSPTLRSVISTTKLSFCTRSGSSACPAWFSSLSASSTM
jgi:hypothetical protein